MNSLKNLPFSFYIIFVFVLCQTGFAVQMALSVSNLDELLQENTQLENNWNVKTYLKKIDELPDFFSNMWEENSTLIMAKRDRLFAAYRSTIVKYVLESAVCSFALLLFYCMYTKKSILLETFNNKFRRNGRQENMLPHCSVPPEVLLRRLLAMSEKEKANLARELHDELGSNLMVIRINLATALDTFGQNDPVLASHLRETLELLKKTVEIKRRIIENLRPSMLENFGLATSIRSHCEDIARRSGMQINIKINGEFAHLDAERAIALYRIVQESLTNIVKYAKATQVSISLNQFEYGARLRIADNGVGIDQEVLKNLKSHGITGMRERAVLSGGNFTIFPSQLGSGTCIDAFIPCVDL